jgi:hypothetical protein
MLVAGDFDGPNGLAFSPDERRLYVSESGDQAKENPPHLELLCYRSPGRSRGEPTALCSNDIAATRLTLEVDDLLALERRLAAACVRFISTGTVTFPDNRPALVIRDPDGHALLLLGR